MSTRQLLLITVGLVLYVMLASTAHVPIVMWQGFDDALFIRLGMHVADGSWLGPYSELTLVKGPIFPIFLAILSLTGLPVDIGQYLFMYAACLYASFTVAKLYGARSGLAILLLLAALLCPTNYIPRTLTLRSFFYTGLTVIVWTQFLHLIYSARPLVSRLLQAALFGVFFALFWYTREEGFWIVPSMVMAQAIRLVALRHEAMSLLFRKEITTAIGVAGGVVGVFLLLGFLNQHYYGKFVLVEVKSSAFQDAMVALQRVGATYQTPFLPLPAEARTQVYSVSPLFAELQPYLDPRNGLSPFASACKYLQTPCGDLPGGWFMWALRDAAAKAGKHTSARAAAEYYSALAAEVAGACESKAVRCISWLPPLIPYVTKDQWRLYPSTFVRALMLLVYRPPSNPEVVKDSLTTPDSADAVEFLNRPNDAWLPELHGRETKSGVWLAKCWMRIIYYANHVYGLIIGGSVIVVILCLTLVPGAMKDSLLLTAVSMLAAGVLRAAFLALIDISSFPAAYHPNMAPANPIVAMGAVLVWYRAWYLARRLDPVGKLQRRVLSWIQRKPRSDP